MKIVSTINATKITLIGQGQGLNSQVFLCHDPQLGGEIVIKEIPIQKFNHPNDYFKEASALYSNKHPRVVPVMYACQDASTIRIAMPYYKNGTLEDLINKTFLTTREIIKISEQFLLGLHHIHSNGFIHFDIKPTNILFADDKSPLISDFGQSRRTNILGVGPVPPLYPSHLFPEAFLSTHTTKQSDIFQVGLTLYRMCNGNNHFRSQFTFQTIHELKNAILNGKFPDRNSYLPHVPLKLRRIINKCLEVNPSNRYQTCLELSNDLVTVNKLLDWRYVPLKNGALWKKETPTHEEFIEIMLNQHNQWDVKGYKRRKSDGFLRNNNKQVKLGFSTYKKAEKFVYKLFRDME
ncbi:serine/threonine-protein kinase [Bacillus alveayuensis]|uniref:serine/threonine-protein kinase n=1 Tax=Aeribacillus alveayuensis TaxID=279215 RepID=UPI0005CCE2C1|nr:serine/threonine-protein kinase [Bacillus alveayuensis]